MPRKRVPKQQRRWGKIPKGSRVNNHQINGVRVEPSVYQALWILRGKTGAFLIDIIADALRTYPPIREIIKTSNNP
ncbi:MAG TPA: hypothetical protein DG761_04360 [Gammaproteobacteria bacterium]|nr:hypothetical protein [Gammaproteobacteria bacterium]